jgi:hypothetical protein
MSNTCHSSTLAKTFIPLALEEMDSEFGGKRDQLAKALRRRADAIDDPAIAEQLLITSESAVEVGS